MPLSPYPLLTPNQLGEELRAARKAMRITQTALARHLGVSQSRVSYLELNPQDLSVSQLFVWCTVVRLELQIVLKDEGASVSRGLDAGAAYAAGATDTVDW